MRRKYRDTDTTTTDNLAVGGTDSPKFLQPQSDSNIASEISKDQPLLQTNGDSPPQAVEEAAQASPPSTIQPLPLNTEFTANEPVPLAEEQLEPSPIQSRQANTADNGTGIEVVLTSPTPVQSDTDCSSEHSEESILKPLAGQNIIKILSFNKLRKGDRYKCQLTDNTCVWKTAEEIPIQILNTYRANRAKTLVKLRKRRFL